jgi:hypothetical protein
MILVEHVACVREREKVPSGFSGENKKNETTWKN